MNINRNDRATINALAAAACRFYGWRTQSGDLDRQNRLYVGSNYAGTVREDGRLVLDNRGAGSTYTIRVGDAVEQFGMGREHREDRDAIGEIIDGDGLGA